MTHMGQVSFALVMHTPACKPRGPLPVDYNDHLIAPTAGENCFGGWLPLVLPPGKGWIKKDWVKVLLYTCEIRNRVMHIHLFLILHSSAKMKVKLQNSFPDIPSSVMNVDVMFFETSYMFNLHHCLKRFTLAKSSAKVNVMSSCCILHSYGLFRLKASIRYALQWKDEI